MRMEQSLEKLSDAVRGGYPLIYIVSWEEDRVESALKALMMMLKIGGDFAVWTSADGLASSRKEAPRALDPVEALEAVLRADRPGIVLFKDLPDSFGDNPRLVRKLRDVYYAGKGRGRHVVILSPSYRLPEALKKEIHLVEFNLPDEHEIYEHMAPLVKKIPHRAGLPEEFVKDLSVALKGLTINEVEHTVAKVLALDLPEEAVMNRVFQEKEQIVKKEGILEFVPPRFSIEEIGGLENLKEWLVRRAHLFTQKAVEENIPLPKGILLMGVSGCGKSLAVKAISSLWKVPLFRLDMNLVFSGLYGSPESIFHRGLKQLEAMAPAVLWIDEIEMGIAGYREGESTTSSHIFAHFLTWMQEKDEMVFVAATANRIHLLPAEIIRKGRFDQIFFLDLPDDEERREIFSIHIKKNGGDPERFDLEFLSISTKGWNGSEIEQVIVAARIDAFFEKRPFGPEDVVRNIMKIVPLSKTMEAQIKEIKGWAFNRAVPASKRLRR
ncbi:MAG: AAA family ATPase [Candidatus Aminicenantes bacterium]|nr:AAA family ATPase [Candidatus Aminicenantes bacterium]